MHALDRKANACWERALDHICKPFQANRDRHSKTCAAEDIIAIIKARCARERNSSLALFSNEKKGSPSASVPDTQRAPTSAGGTPQSMLRAPPRVAPSVQMSGAPANGLKVLFNSYCFG